MQLIDLFKYVTCDEIPVTSIKLVASKIADAVLEGKELRQNKATAGKIEKIEAKDAGVEEANAESEAKEEQTV